MMDGSFAHVHLQKVKYIALLALTKIVPSYPHLVAEYESKILSSIDDPDLSIRMRALDLISAMVGATSRLRFKRTHAIATF